MNKTIRFIAAIYCFTFGASLAYAEPMGHDGSKHDERMSRDRHFKEMDTNGDGMISKAEFDIAHTKHFQEMDTDGDGKLSGDEMRAGHASKMEQGKGMRFKDADANHDGALTREEAKKMPMLSKRFDETDANHDGKVTSEEMDAAMKKMRSGKGEMMHHDQGENKAP